METLVIQTILEHLPLLIFLFSLSVNNIESKNTNPMSNKFHLFLATALVSGALVFSSCEKEAEKDVYPDPIALPKSSRIKFVHEAYGLGLRVNIAISDSVIAVNLPTLDFVSPYLSVPLGSQNLEWKNSADSTGLFSASINAEEGRFYTTFVTLDGSGNPVNLILEDDLTTPATGNAHLRFVHMSPDAPNVDISLWSTAKEMTANDTKDFTVNGAGVSFTLTKAVKLDSIAIKSVSGTSINIALYDSAGTTQLQTSGAVSLVSGEMKKVYLGWSLQPGTYRLVGDNLNGSFIGSDDGVSYPTPLTGLGLGRLNGSFDSPSGNVDAGSGKYYYFYDWDFKVEENIVANSAFMTASSYAPFSGGQYDVVVNVAGSPSAIALRVDDVDFGSGNIYTLIARGYLASGASTPLGAKLFRDK